MTVLWLTITVVALVAGAAAGVWLLVLAFREHLGWGLACLLLPFAAVAYAIRYWEEAKKPFVLSLVGLTLALVGGLGYSASSVNQGLGEYGSLSSGSDSRPLSAAVDPRTDFGIATPADEDDAAADEAEPVTMTEEVQARPLGDDAGRVETDEEPMAADEAPSPRGRSRDQGIAIPVSSLGSMVGELVQIELSSGKRMSVRVEAVGDGSVRVRQRVGGGSIAFTIELDDIVEVLSRTES